MRFARHLIAGVLVLVILLIAAVAFALYDPFSSSPRRLTLSQLITAPPGTRSVSPELPIQDTDPAWLADLARRYQPLLVVSGYDRFWPMSLGSILDERWDGHGACLYEQGHCRVQDPTLASFATTGTTSDWLQLSSPLDSITDTFEAVAGQLGFAPAVLHGWPTDIRHEDPFPTAQLYFYELARTRRHSYPGVPAGMISLEYWFFYPLNYFPLVRIPLLALRDPITSTLGNTDYHQGDLEHVAVIVDPRTLRPRDLYMARHSGEGVTYRWGSKSVQWDGTHPFVYAALGSHASYAHCGIQRRPRTFWFINDYVVCAPHETFGFTPSETPLVDLTHTRWACWRGHFGQAGRDLIAGLIGLAPYETDGPPSPLLQQENFRTACHLPPAVRKPVAPL